MEINVANGELVCWSLRSTSMVLYSQGQVLTFSYLRLFFEVLAASNNHRIQSDGPQGI